MAVYKLCRFPSGVPWVRYHGMYKDLHINLIWPGKDSALGKYLILQIKLGFYLLSKYSFKLPIMTIEMNTLKYITFTLVEELALIM